ncbi:hypothetical protein GCM10025762_24970 [Haloechinothrix salitolerans]
MANHHRTALLRLALCFGMLIVVLGQVWVNSGVLIVIDRAARTLVDAEQYPILTAIALGADHIGQREPIAGVLLGCAATLARYQRTWRPIVLSIAALLAVNFVVGVLKISYGRGKPQFGDTAPFVDGMIFPSGHTANVVITWGLLAYILITYGYLRRRRAAIRIVITLSLLMGLISWYLDTHWVTDIIAGWLIGAILLQGLILIDTMWRWRPPRTAALAELPTEVIRFPDSPAELRTTEPTGVR